MNERLAHNARWVIVSVNKPVMLRRSDDETWLLNPRRRYILNADILEELSTHIETMSDLQASSLYRPLQSAAKVRLPHSTVLIERYRDRGIGDLLFTTGPLAYLHHITGGDLKCYLYAYAERGAVMNYCPFLADQSPLVGPVIYDELPYYNFHWFIDTVTEYSEEPDQLNVYDAMFRSLGIDPEGVDARFKRPMAQTAPHESRTLDDFFFWVFQNTNPHLDLRKTGYYVIAPFANSSLRSAKYDTWIRVIGELSEHRPVVVVGVLRERMPTTDMSPGDFVNILDSNDRLVKSGRVVNLVGKTSVRNLMQLISKANCVGSMDSAALYIAQALRVPCVSLWGSHDPGVRIGYDKDYMDLAIWNQTVCPASPCFAWQGFPITKCPAGPNQTVCECLNYLDEKAVVRRFEAVESNAPKLVRAAAPVPLPA
jgi:Glycosyltransferase family 9 (heptosyltransferase)